jgi:hypothetical protein
MSFSKIFGWHLEHLFIFIVQKIQVFLNFFFWISYSTRSNHPVAEMLCSHVPTLYFTSRDSLAWPVQRYDYDRLRRLFGCVRIEFKRQRIETTLGSWLGVSKVAFNWGVPENRVKLFLQKLGIMKRASSSSASLALVLAIVAMVCFSLPCFALQGNKPSLDVQSCWLALLVH